MMKWKVAQQLEGLWWRRYLHNKDVDTYLKWKKTYWFNFIEQNECQIGTSCLDLGCGPAGIFTILNDRQTVAVDPLLNEYEKKLAHFNRSMYPEVEFVQSKMELFQSNRYFDTLFCLNAINHVDDLPKAILTIANLMQKESIAYISIDAHKYGMLQQIFKWIPADALHPHQLTKKQYIDAFKDQGLDVVSSRLVKKGRIFDYLLFTLKKNRPN